MPGVITAEALEHVEDPDSPRVHLVRPESIRPLGDGRCEAITLCGEKVIGRLAGDASRLPVCDHCLAAR